MNWRKEIGHVAYAIQRQVFLKIPTVSGATALLVGMWVAGTFRYSPVRNFLARGRIFHGSHHYVDKTTYRFLSIILPMIVAALTAYFVQRYLRQRRALWLERDMQTVWGKSAVVQDEIKRREAILNESLRLGLITADEHTIKRADLYAAYARDTSSSPLKKLIAQKLT